MCVWGLQEGALEVFDLGAAERIFSDTSAHEGAVWSIAMLPDNTGFVTGSADKTVKFWQVCNPRCLKMICHHATKKHKQQRQRSWVIVELCSARQVRQVSGSSARSLNGCRQ
eukprot:scaffold42056_cov20-Tisochrysis_lutea.AAC.1